MCSGVGVVRLRVRRPSGLRLVFRQIHENSAVLGLDPGARWRDLDGL